MGRKTAQPKVWRFTEGRRNSLKRAQKTHVYLVKLGERAFAKGMR